MNSINMMLFVKDKYNNSGGAYHEMTRICKTLPQHYKLKDRIKELNKLWCIKPTPNGITEFSNQLPNDWSLFYNVWYGKA